MDPKLGAYQAAEVAARYDERWSGRSGRARDARKRRAVREALALANELAPILKIVDVPCGTGRFTPLALELGLAYAGVDLSIEMLARARERCPAAALAAGDLARLPLASESVDAALCIRFLHLVRERGQRVLFLRELARVARHAVVVDYRWTRSLNVWIQNARARAGLRRRASGALPLAAIEAELADAGLALVRAIPVRRVPYASDKVVLLARRN